MADANDYDDNAENPSPAQIVDSTRDLLTEIFIRLPIKPLCQLKTVSKHWESQISDPDLQLIYTRAHDPVTTGLIFHNRSGRPYIVSLDKSPTAQSFQDVEFARGSPLPWGMKVYSSCNGLLICGVKELEHSLWGYYICNPTTRSYSRLPDLEGGNWIRGIYLAFNPYKSTHYKVVCVRRLGMVDESLSSTFDVYSSETRSWRKVGDRPFTFKVNLKDGVHWNGSIHWLSDSKEGESIYFNPDDDDDQMPTKVMPTPPILDVPCWERTHHHHLGESCGHLHYVDMCMENEHHEFHVYEMRRDYSEWFRKYKVDVPEVVVERYSYPFIFIGTLVRGKKDEDSFLVFVDKKSMVRCNLVLGTFETIGDVTSDFLYFNDALPFPYIGSFASV